MKKNYQFVRKVFPEMKEKVIKIDTVELRIKSPERKIRKRKFL